MKTKQPKSSWEDTVKGCKRVVKDSRSLKYSDNNNDSDTIDGRNIAPPNMHETLSIMGYLPHQLVQDFFHQQ